MEHAIDKAIYLSRAFDLGTKTKSLTIHSDNEVESEKIDGNRVKYHRDTEAVLLEKRQKKISKLGDLDDKFESQAVFEKIEKIDKYLKKFFDKKISPPPEPSVPERPNFLRVQPSLHIDFIGDIY